LLWWAFTKHSRSLNGAYNSFPVATIALSAPVDIFGFLRDVPPAPETETILLHILWGMPDAKEVELSFKNYLTGLGHDSAKQLARSVPQTCAALCPVMWGISAVA